MSYHPSLPSGSIFAPISSGISLIILTIMPGVMGALTPTSDSAKKRILLHQLDLLLHQTARRLIWKMMVSYDEKTIWYAVYAKNSTYYHSSKCRGKLAS
jgi:hypothetical protein